MNYLTMSVSVPTDQQLKKVGSNKLKSEPNVIFYEGSQHSLSNQNQIVDALSSKQPSEYPFSVKSAKTPLEHRKPN